MLQKTQLVHEECRGADLECFRISNDLSNDELGGILFRISQDLLEALLNETGEEDERAISSPCNLVILEQDVRAEQLDGLVYDIVR